VWRSTYANSTASASTTAVKKCPFLHASDVPSLASVGWISAPVASVEII